MSESPEPTSPPEPDRPQPDEVLIGSARRPIPARARVAVVPIAAGLGLSLVGVEVAQEGTRTVLWVYLDKEGGLTLEDCERAHPEISAALDVEDPIAETYELRVSSPGLDRPLMSSADFLCHAGETVLVQLGVPHEGRRKYTGVIGPVHGEDVELKCADGTFAVPLEKMSKARLKFEIPQGGQKKSAGKKP